MQVVAYLYHADLLLEDEQGVAVITGSHYVLSLGDKVIIQQLIDEQVGLYQVQISFACAEHAMLHQDHIQLKFEGCHEQFKVYQRTRLVH